MKHMLQRSFTLVLLTFMIMPAASAGVIYKWVDEKGVTHFSDEAPSTEAIQATQIDLPEEKATERKTDENYYSIANQWARLHQERLEREKLRLAQQAKASKKPAVTVVYEEKENDSYALVYRKPYYKKRHHKHKKPAVNPGYTYRYYQSKYPPGLHPGRKSSTKAVGKTSQ